VCLLRKNTGLASYTEWKDFCSSTCINGQHVQEVEFSESVLTCQCNDGYGYVDIDLANNCSICLPGNYSDGILCKSCPPGTFTNYSGAIECMDCPANHFSNHSGSTFCYGCPGNLTSIAGQRVCKCALYQKLDKLNSVCIDMCDPSAVYLDQGCVCNVNAYISPDSSPLICLDCPSNSYTNQLNATLCMVCNGYLCHPPPYIPSSSTPTYYCYSPVLAVLQQHQ
jgi:hypothetical protein